MPAPSDSILKLNRALDHLDALKRSIDETLNAKPFRIDATPAVESDRVRVMYTAHLRNPVPTAWSLQIGDFAHNARSALDVLIYHLSTLPGDHAKRRDLVFPIRDSQTKFREAVAQCLVGVTDRDRGIIEEMQPGHFSTPEQRVDPLVMLAQINNTDKHRIIPVVSAIGRMQDVGVGSGRIGENFFAGRDAGVRFTFSPGSAGHESGAGFSFGGVMFRSLGDGVIAVDGTPVCEMVFDSTDDIPASQIDMQFNYEAHVLFGGSCPLVRNHSVVEVLESIAHRVDGVLKAFP